MRNTLALGLFVSLAFTQALNAQSKIEEAVTDQLRHTEKVRVIIVTRPEPGNAANSIQGVANILGSQSNVRAVGQLPVATAEVSELQLSLLNEDPNVVTVFRDVPVPPALYDSGPLVGTPKVKTLGLSGDGIAVAILDTGVQVDHPALSNSVAKEACFSTSQSPDGEVESLCPGGHEVSLLAGAAAQCPASVTGCEHGTHVAGIVAGHSMQFETHSFDGIAPSAKIIAVQVFTLFKNNPLCGSENTCVLSYTSDQLRALEWVYKQRNTYNIASVNMSLGGGYYDDYCDKDTPLTEIIERLRSKGIATVVASGNDGFYDGMSSPACVSAAVSVAALDKANKLDVSYSNVSKLLDIAAPGTDIVSSVTGSAYGSLSGTSMAAPHVAGAFAILRQKYPDETVKQLEQRLIAKAAMANDPRTDIQLPVLELAHAVIVDGDAAPPVGVTSEPTTGKSDVAGNRFILRTETSGEVIQNSLNSECEGLSCEVKQIGKDTFILDFNSLSQGGKPTIADRGDIKDLIKKIDPTATIFNNDLSSPM